MKLILILIHSLVCLCAYVWGFFSFFNVRINKPSSNPLPHLFGESCFFHHRANFMVYCLPCFSLVFSMQNVALLPMEIRNSQLQVCILLFTLLFLEYGTFYNPTRPPQTSHGMWKAVGEQKIILSLAHFVLIWYKYYMLLLPFSLRLCFLLFMAAEVGQKPAIACCVLHETAEEDTFL